MIKKPMLAATIEDFEDIRFPAYVSPKYDGVRCMIQDHKLYSRKGEPFDNPEVQKAFDEFCDILGHRRASSYTDLDGELGIGEPTTKDFFTKTSGLLRREGASTAGLIFYAFDRMVDSSFEARWRNDMAEGKFPVVSKDFSVAVVPQHLVTNIEELDTWERYYTNLGYEGVMVRSISPDEPYKHGRASMNSQELMKYKRFKDEEGILLGFEEAMINTNEATKDAFGHTKRSSAKAGKVPAGRVGKMIVRLPSFPTPVKVGTFKGLKRPDLIDMWLHPEKYIGRKVTIAWQEGSDYEEPRFASFKGFRDDGI